MGRWLVMAVVALLVVGCAGETDGSSGDPPQPEAPESDPDPEPEPEDDEDAVAQMACRHFRNVAGDASSGVLNDTELREKIKEVREDARYADTPEIRRQSEAMLAAITQGDMDAFSEAVNGFDAACSELGY